VTASDRIRRAQANPHRLPKKHALNKRAASVTYTSTSTSPAPTTAAYNGRQTDTSACSNQATSDGCTDPVYTVATGEVDLANGGTFQAGGHVNFQVSRFFSNFRTLPQGLTRLHSQYIPYSQYTGTGSYRNKPSTWTATSCGLNFDPNKSVQPDSAVLCYLR
jgi:hypothetical protein